MNAFEWFTVIALIVVGVANLGLALRSAHRHKWAPVSVRTGQRVHFIEGESKLGGDATLVLYVCKCGKNKTEHIDGTWSAEELFGREVSHV